MERRKFVVGLGALASGSAAAVGTGAFSFVSASRDLSINVADDSNAFLALSVQNSSYADGSDDELEVNFDSSSAPNGTGVNNDALSEFPNVFRVENKGDRAVRVNGYADADYNQLPSEISMPAVESDGTEERGGMDLDLNIANTGGAGAGEIQLDPGQYADISFSFELQGADQSTINDVEAVSNIQIVADEL